MIKRAIPVVFAVLLQAGISSQAHSTGQIRPRGRYLLQNQYLFMAVPHAPRHDHRIHPEMLRAAQIAVQRSSTHPNLLCWRYVKQALLASGAVRQYPASVYAREAGAELVDRFGFVRLPIQDPYLAPVGAVLVYSGHGSGHVEMRSENGFVSDFHSHRACPWPLTGIYAKLIPS